MIHILSGTVHIDNINSFLKNLENIGQKYNATVQALDADKIAGEKHLRFAVEKAVRSWESGRNIAGNLAMEILLYAAGKRQIGKALLMGIHRGNNNVAIVCVNENDKPLVELQGLIVPKKVLDLSNTKIKTILDIFEITESEINAVGKDKIQDLVLERVALLDVLKQ